MNAPLIGLVAGLLLTLAITTGGVLGLLLALLLGGGGYVLAGHLAGDLDLSAVTRGRRD